MRHRNYNSVAFYKDTVTGEDYRVYFDENYEEVMVLDVEGNDVTEETLDIPLSKLDYQECCPRCLNTPECDYDCGYDS